MKKILLIFLLIFFSFSYSNAAIFYKKQQNDTEITQKISAPNPLESLITNAQGDRWGVFWVNFAIAAIGAYSIYGFLAFVVSPGLTYFIYNGEKKATHKAIFGAIAGFIVGAAIRLATIFL